MVFGGYSMLTDLCQTTTAIVDCQDDANPKTMRIPKTIRIPKAIRMPQMQRIPNTMRTPTMRSLKNADPKDVSNSQDEAESLDANAQEEANIKDEGYQARLRKSACFPQICVCVSVYKARRSLDGLGKHDS